MRSAILADLPPTERDKLLDRAAAALREGELVVLPTETVYGLAASAASAEAVEKLRRATNAAEGDGGVNGAGASPPFALHLSDPGDTLGRLERPTAVARRLTARLMPGPVSFVLEQPAGVLDRLRTGLGVEPGVIDDGSMVALRAPEVEATREVLRRAGVPVVARRLSAASWAGVGADRSIGVIPEAADDPLPAVVLDDGPARIGRPSTRVTVRLDGSFAVADGGALSEREVLAALERTVLFVCTGNTCRSPMAEAIAAKLASERPVDGVGTRVISAGVAAADGLPASREAVEVLRKRGLDLSAHRARRLSPELIRAAEVIFTMTPSHAEAVMTMAPDEAHKVFPLDPRGVVPDPIGQPVEQYERTADRLSELIAARLQELEP
jgi:protein-tyrosine phosphatase